MDDLLNNVMLYWVTNSITTSMRFYKENFGNIKKNQEELLGIFMNPIKNVPAAVAAYSDEIFLFGEVELKGKFQNIVQFRTMAEGGHFAAMEDPVRLYEDIYEFVHKIESDKSENRKRVSYEL